ncbi:hypothetical protein SDC9_84189 [bioreactor metagenome]|uniref:Uncharacterized protein n=1 Tax=bioreactor metagenome TaxID=1076179 RepID=A0A644ZCG3_9ZZZZ
MIGFTRELFFQVFNTIFLIFILFLGYKLLCCSSEFLCKIVKNTKNNSK